MHECYVLYYSRHSRFMKRRNKDLKVNDNKNINILKKENDSKNICENYNSENVEENFMDCDNPKFSDAECQVDFFSNCVENSKTFTCNCVSVNGINHVQIQTEINVCSTVKIQNRKKYSDKSVNTDTKKFADKGCTVDPIITGVLKDKKNFWFSVSCIDNDEQLIDLAGVLSETFNLFLKIMPVAQLSGIVTSN